MLNCWVRFHGPLLGKHGETIIRVMYFKPLWIYFLFSPMRVFPPMCRFWHAVMQILTAENIELYILLPTVPMLVRSSTDFHMYPALFCRHRIYLLQSLE